MINSAGDVGAQPLRYTLRTLKGDIISTASATGDFVMTQCALNKQECLFTVTLTGITEVNTCLFGQVWAKGIVPGRYAPCASYRRAGQRHASPGSARQMRMPI